MIGIKIFSPRFSLAVIVSEYPHPVPLIETEAGAYLKPGA